MPYRSFLPQAVRYTGIDVPQASAFSMQGNEEVVPFDGFSIPFPDASFDTVLCTEVLEHSPRASGPYRRNEASAEAGRDTDRHGALFRAGSLCAL